jgi:hypothetical protein
MKFITLSKSKGEARADSRVLAEQLGNQHENSSLATRLKRYNDQMTIIRALELQGGTE